MHFTNVPDYRRLLYRTVFQTLNAEHLILILQQLFIFQKSMRAIWIFVRKAPLLFDMYLFRLMRLPVRFLKVLLFRFRAQPLPTDNVLKCQPPFREMGIHLMVGH